MKRNKFSLSNYKLFSCDLGELVPCGLFEVLPGDTIQMSTSALVRAAPLLSPVMHPVHIRIHHWYVPYRLIWDDFEKFITGGADGLDATAYPTITNAAGGWTVGSLADYLGWPTGVNNIQGSALPHRAYAAIFNAFYRDQDLQTLLPVVSTNGNDVTTNHTLQNCGWEKDYFTSARPWEQKGVAVTVPIGTSAPVKTSVADQATGVQEALRMRTIAGALPGQNALAVNTTGKVYQSNQSGGTVTADVYPSNLFTDLSAASAVTVNTLRLALAAQRMEEARARWGSRYTEYLRSYGIRSSDARLQLPEYLGGGRQTIQFSEVIQSGVTTSGNTLGVGNLRGHGIGAMRSNRFRRFIEEHGLVLSLMSIRPKTMYFQGLPRMYNRRVKEDFWQRELEHVGQMAIKNKELYAAHTLPEATFGYQDRYDDYRRQESSIGGEFRTTLNHWHMARDFSSDPALNATFVKSVPTERTFAVPSEDVIYVMANHSIQARRMLSRTGTSFIF